MKKILVSLHMALVEGMKKCDDRKSTNYYFYLIKKKSG